MNGYSEHANEIERIVYSTGEYITSRCMHSPRLIITIDRLEDRPYM